MTIHTPHRWAVIEVTNTATGEKINKILGGWSGGYLDSDSWQINSGIERVEVVDNCFIFHGYSGSEYHCGKTSYGTTMLSGSAFCSLADRLEESGKGSMRMLSEEEAMSLYES